MPPAPRRSPRAAPVRAAPVRAGAGSGRRPAAPHPLARSGGAPPERPQSMPFAMVFAGLVAVEELYLGWLLWEPDPGMHWYVLVAVALAAGTVLAAVLVWQGRRRAWVVLAAASVLPLLGLLALALLFGALGGGKALWWAVLLLTGPLGCLVFAAGAPIREWTAPRPHPGEPAKKRPPGRRAR